MGFHNLHQIHLGLGHPCQGHSLVLKYLALTSFLFPILTCSQILCLLTLLLIFFNSASSLQPGTQHLPLTVVLILFSTSFSSLFSTASSGFIFRYRSSVSHGWHACRAHPFLLSRAETAQNKHVYSKYQSTRGKKECAEGCQ